MNDDGIQREWLKYNEGENKKFCTLCSIRTSVFVSGTSNFKLESIKAHEVSSAHETHMASTSDPTKSPAAMIIQTLTTVDKIQIEKLIRSAHAFGEKAAPLNGCV